MLLGTPVVATGWSGSSDFLTDATGYPVQATLRPVRPGEYPFAYGLWAEPDIDDAAARLREVYDDPAGSRSRAAAARRLVHDIYGLQAVADGLHRRLALISEALEGIGGPAGTGAE